MFWVTNAVIKKFPSWAPFSHPCPDHIIYSWRFCFDELVINHYFLLSMGVIEITETIENTSKVSCVLFSTFILVKVLDKNFHKYVHNNFIVVVR